MMYGDISSKIDDSWEAAKAAWKDNQAREYENNCIEPTREALLSLHTTQKSIIQTLEEFDQKIKKYE